MKKIAVLVLALVLLFTAYGTLAGSTEIPQFETMGEAEDAAMETGSCHYAADCFVVALGKDGRYFRYTARMDERGTQLFHETPDNPSWTEYRRHIHALPVTCAEELTAVPLPQEELDALAGKTLESIFSDPDVSYYCFLSDDPGMAQEAVFHMEYGFFSYALVISESAEECRACMERNEIGGLTVKSAALAGLSAAASDPDYLPDGTRKPKE